MSFQIRPRIDGGCSPCNSDDAHIGRGRCIHVGDEPKNFTLSKSSSNKEIYIDKNGFPRKLSQFKMSRLDRRTVVAELEYLDDDELEFAENALKNFPKNTFKIDNDVA